MKLKKGMIALALTALLSSPLYAQQISPLLKPEIQARVKKLTPAQKEILVGQYVVFDPIWLTLKDLPHDDLKQWRIRTDAICKSYATLTGYTPPELIFIAAMPQSEFDKPIYIAHTHRDMNSICFNYTSSNFRPMLKEIKDGSYSCTMMHELGHIFARASGESTANFFMAYALEHIEAPPGAWFLDIQNAATLGKKLTGPEFRQDKTASVLQTHKTRGTRMPKTANSHEDSIHDLILFGLFEKAGGWQTYEKVFQSYAPNSTYTPPRKFTGQNADNIILCDLLDRIVHFSNDPKLLSDFPPALLASLTTGITATPTK